MPKFKPGESGNPKGRPPKKGSYTDSLRRVLEAEEMCIELLVNGEAKKIHVVSKGKNFYDGIAVVQIMEALKGNMQAIRDISDRVDGRPIQMVSTTTDNQGIIASYFNSMNPDNKKG